MTLTLTTKDRIDARLATPATATGEDVLLNALIARVSYAFEREMNRQTEATTYTKQFDVHGGKQIFHLDAYPVTSITTIHHDLDRAFGTVDLIDADDYYIESESGRLIMELYLAPGPGVLKVVWEGGMAATQAAFQEAYPDIVEAADMQVSYLFQRRNAVGVSGESVAGSNLTLFSAADLLPDVKAILHKYRRMAHV